jgi:hypothetical protein
MSQLAVGESRRGSGAVRLALERWRLRGANRRAVFTLKSVAKQKTALERAAFCSRRSTLPDNRRCCYGAAFKTTTHIAPPPLLKDSWAPKRRRMTVLSCKNRGLSSARIDLRWSWRGVRATTGRGGTRCRPRPGVPGGWMARLAWLAWRGTRDKPCALYGSLAAA